jgi:putative tryptophan/tyrosine transport system substrate-binding protein
VDRRCFLTWILAILVAPVAAEAQLQDKHLPRVGFLASGFGPSSDQRLEMMAGLQEFGFMEGQSVLLESRFAEGNAKRIPALAADLIAQHVAVLLAIGPSVLRTVRDATNTLPIVALDFETDPVEAGFAQSLARPGRNITGVFLDQAGLSGKWLELVSEIVPRLSRVAVMWDATTPTNQLRALKSAAAPLGVHVQTLEVRELPDLEGAFAAAAKGGAQAMVILGAPLLSRHGTRLAELSIATRLPLVSPFRENTAVGCLMSYGPRLTDAYHRIGVFAGRILKGATAGDLPIERPTRFELLINQKTARALGLVIPPSLMLRADEVIHP